MNRHRLVFFALAALLPLTVPAQQMPLNDTGQDRCYDGADLVACSEANSGDTATYPRQDGRFGRDAQAAAGQLAKTGGGNAGFDFTRICNSGEAAGTGNCPADPELGDGANDWACTQDNVTGLIWEVKTEDNENDTYTWVNATADYAAAVNTAELCGFDDWRLPSRRELLSIIDHDTASPAIDTDYFPNTVSYYYWSADSYAPGPSSAWNVNFVNGGSSAFVKADGFHVRLVRGGQPADLNTCPSQTDYTDNGDGTVTVTDDVTDLIWDQCSWGQTLDDGSCTGTASTHNWEAALGVAVTANGQQYLGHDDWRLSSRTELESLVDPACSSPAINTAFFPDTPGNYYWSSTTLAPGPGNAWLVVFDDGFTFADFKSFGLRVRLVRGGQSFDALTSYAIDITIDPADVGTASCEPNPVPVGKSSICTATPDDDYIIDMVGGSCGGTLVGDIYTTEPITEDCTVEAEFVQVSVSGDSPTGSGPISAEVSGGGSGCGFERGEFVALDSVATPPAFVEFPHGLFDFELSGCEVGATATLTVTYPEPLPSGAVYWKFGPTADDPDPHWYQLAATIDGNSATFSLTDGGLGDGDLEANGRIVDPSGPGELRLPPIEPKPIPTLQVWGLLLLAGLLGLIGMRHRRRAGG